MKNLVVLGLMALCAVDCVSQTLVKEMEQADTRFIPGAYMKSGEAAIYFSSDEYGYDEYQAEIYDFELNPLKSFSFEFLHPYTLNESRRATGKKVLTKTLTHQVGQWVTGAPSTSDMEARKEGFIQIVYDEERYKNPAVTLDGLRSNARIDGTSVFIGIPAVNDYLYPHSDYLTTVEYCLYADNSYGLVCYYTISVPICDGEWEESTWYDVPVRNLCVARCNDVSHLNHWNAGLFLPFSQTFFNDDEKFEYVRFNARIAEGTTLSYVEPENPSDSKYVLFGVTSSDRDGDGEIDVRSTYYGVHISGVEVVSEDGTVIYNLPLDADCIGKPSVEIYKSSNSLLAQIDFTRYNEDNQSFRTVRFYRIDKTTGAAKMVREERQATANPNPSSVGTPVVMTLPAGSNRYVEVSDVNGVKRFSIPVESGADRVSVPTDRLSSGMYLFTVVSDGVIIDTCKIIIR